MIFTRRIGLSQICRGEFPVLPVKLMSSFILIASILFLQRMLDSQLSLDRFSHEEAVLEFDCFHCHYPPRAAYHARWVGSCSKCHGTSAWKPANFEHRYFPLQSYHKAECSTCHPATAAAYTCGGCHKMKEMKPKHSKLQINEASLNDCVICHPKGKVMEGE